MNETDFHRLADSTLTSIYDMLEDIDKNGALDIEYQGGILTIDLPSGRQLLLSKHAPSRQIWLSSPASGGLHFSHGTAWVLADGRTLQDVLAQELRALANIEVKW